MNQDGGASPFDSFSAAYKSVLRAGLCDLLKQPALFKRFCFQIYRLLSFCICLGYNMLYIIYMILMRNNTDLVLESLMSEITHFILIIKIINLNLGASRLRKLHDLMNEPIFSYYEKDRSYHKKNRDLMHRFMKTVNIAMTVSCMVWVLSLFAKRLFDENAELALYIPFEINTWMRYIFAVMICCIPCIWVGYGHVALDVLIVTYYAQAILQFRIIKYHLTHLADSTSDVVRGPLEYADDVDETVKEKFVHCVQRFDKVVWFTYEVMSIFNVPLSCQFILTSASICLVIYKMSATEILSSTFGFLLCLEMLFLGQIFLYCYFGNVVVTESSSVADALYVGEWWRLSPKLRKQLLIAMVQWSRPITPTALKIFPLSLDSFIKILKSAYSLFTVLKTTH